MSNGRSGSRILQLALFASLAVNLFIAGFFVAHWWSHRGPRPEHALEAIVERASAKLPDQDRAILLAAWNANRAKLTSLFGELQSARREVRVKLTAEPFDRDALAAAMANTRAKRVAFSEAVQSVFLDTVPKFSPEGRNRLWAPGSD
jgi:uncharacterized membrane protein